MIEPGFHLGEHAPLDRAHARLLVVARIDVPQDRRQPERARRALDRRVDVAVGRAEHARRVAAQRADRVDRALQLRAHFVGAQGRQVGMRERVVARHVAFAQLVQDRVAVLRGDLPADHEERRLRVVAREHAHERRRVGVRPVVEADRHLPSRWPLPVRGGAVADAADDAIQLGARARRRAEHRAGQRAPAIDQARRAERSGSGAAAVRQQRREHGDRPRRRDQRCDLACRARVRRRDRGQPCGPPPGPRRERRTKQRHGASAAEPTRRSCAGSRRRPTPAAS